MPQVRCPDCFQDVTVMHHELARVIKCPVCEAEIGPLISAPPGSPPAPRPAFPPASEVAELPPVESTPKTRLKGKRVKPKTAMRFVPILLGIVIGLGGTAALLGAIYVLIASQIAPVKPADTPPAKADTPTTPPPTVRPSSVPSR